MHMVLNTFSSKLCLLSVKIVLNNLQFFTNFLSTPNRIIIGSYLTLYSLITAHLPIKSIGKFCLDVIPLCWDKNS